MRLGDLDALKDNMFHYAAPEMMWDRGDIEHKINEMPTIDAIPVEWLNKHKIEYLDDWGENLVTVERALKVWQQEQEAR